MSKQSKCGAGASVGQSQVGENRCSVLYDSKHYAKPNFDYLVYLQDSW